MEKLTKDELVDIIDSACWSARAYGHDDNGLDEDVHPSAIEAAERIMQVLEVEW